MPYCSWPQPVGLCSPARPSPMRMCSPPVALAKEGQVFTLAVPTEEENAATTKIELTPPAGFAIDSFAPVPGWKREVQSTAAARRPRFRK